MRSEVRFIRVAAAGLVLAAVAFGPADAGGRRGSGYGVQGGVTDDLALANVFSGIYGLQYTYDRANYDFNAPPCDRPFYDERGNLLVRRCR